MLKYLLILASGIFVGALGYSISRGDEPPVSDQQFVAEAASAGMFEVQLGEYASKNGATADVKKFGKEMVADHAKANDELKKVATDQKLELPKDLNTADKKTLDEMEKLTGAEFDAKYAALMVKAHKEVISEFENEVSHGTDVSVKAFAEKTLPTLRHHLEMAQNMNTNPM